MCSLLSPDLTASDYHLFRGIQNFSDGKMFTSEDNFRKHSPHFLILSPTIYFFFLKNELQKRLLQALADLDVLGQILPGTVL